jgi:histidinol-phosphate aminotransferase
MEIEKLIRENIRTLLPYSTARDEAEKGYDIYLDANESPFNNTVNRYPDPRQLELKKAVSGIKSIPCGRIFVGNGSDEAIDLLFRVFCEPGTDNAVAISPSYGMYGVAARINNVEFREVMLRNDFSLDPDALLAKSDERTKLIFLCSPNNPSGNLMERGAVEKIAGEFKGLLVIDEAYIDFSGTGSFLSKLEDYPNLVILQTLSKAWGLAGLRVGFAFASEKIISVMTKVKYPYNIGSDTLEKAIGYLKTPIENKVRMIVEERAKLAARLSEFPEVEKVYPSETNFILVRFRDSRKIYEKLISNGIVVRDRSSLPLCEGTLRITVGTPGENDSLLKVLEGEVLAARNERRISLSRQTSETSVILELDLDGGFASRVQTSLPFFDHMLEQLAFHSGISMILKASGDIQRDEHHTVEDCAIVLGEAIDKALGGKVGISRYGFTLPMDESLANVAIDLGGRPYLRWDVRFVSNEVGGINTDMFRHFFYSLAVSSRSTIHISARGENDHHRIEAIFKAYARSLRMALRREGSVYELPSTKGLI